MKVDQEKLLSSGGSETVSQNREMALKALRNTKPVAVRQSMQEQGQRMKRPGEVRMFVHNYLRSTAK